MATCLVLDDCQWPAVTVGLLLPLLMSRPGLDQPPPGTGDGLRDKDMGSVGVPATGDSGLWLA